MATGLSPREQSLTLYIMTGFPRHDALMQKLGRYTTGRSCLYVKKLEDVDTDVLRELVRASVEQVAERALRLLTPTGWAPQPAAR